MKGQSFFKYFSAAFFGLALLFVFSSTASAQRKVVKVTFQAGIYRDWDKAWMTTAPEDVVAAITTSRGTFTKSPTSYKGNITFENIPCNEQVKINIRFVGTAAYKSNSRSYTKQIPCGKATVNLGKLEYGRW